MVTLAVTLSDCSQLRSFCFISLEWSKILSLVLQLNFGTQSSVDSKKYQGRYTFEELGQTVVSG